MRTRKEDDERYNRSHSADQFVVGGFWKEEREREEQKGREAEGKGEDEN